MNKTKAKTYKLVLLALLTALVVVLQVFSNFFHFGMFAITLVLVPVVVGSVIAGPFGGAWLGFVFGVVVLLTDAMAFLGVSVPATVTVVLLKGTLGGLAAGYVYKLLEKRGKYIPVMAAAVTCPIINTGVFVIGTYLFFMPLINEWAAAEGVSSAIFIFGGLVGVNFIIELAVNVVLAPVIVRILDLPQFRRVK